MNLRELQADPQAFRQALLIDADAGPTPFAEAMDDWQRRDFQALDAGWLATVTGKTTDNPVHRGWLERPRGHSKTLDLAVMILWALFASRRPLAGYAAAADKDQARLLRDAIGRLLYVNPWLSQVIEVQNYRVINKHTDSWLEILSSDAPTSYGILADFIICDEVAHWQKRDLWDSLLSSAAKRKHCQLVVITNAGFEQSWQWNTREAIRTNPSWHFSRLEGPVASWIDEQQLREQEALLPSAAFRRLWHNEWSDSGGDALSRDLIDAAFNDKLRPMPRPQPGYEFLAGLDLGISRDASALVVLGVRRASRQEHDIRQHGRIRLVHAQAWRATPKHKVNLQNIEDTLLALHDKYQFKEIAFDPWQAEHLSQRLRLSRVPMTELTQTGQNLQRIASATLEAFNDRRLDLYPQEELHRDLTRLRVEERAYGFRLVSPRDAMGHGDLASAFCYALLLANERAGKQKRIHGSMFPDQHARDPAERRILKARRAWSRGIHPANGERISELSNPDSFR